MRGQRILPINRTDFKGEPFEGENPIVNDKSKAGSAFENSTRPMEPLEGATRIPILRS